MKCEFVCLPAGVFGLALLLPLPAIASWPADPLVNVPLCTASGTQQSPAIVSDGAGGAIVTWEDYRSGSGFIDLYTQRVSAFGAVLWTADGVPLCSASGSKWNAKMASDDAGGAIVIWERAPFGDSNLYAQRISADGVTKWAADGVALCTAVNQQTLATIVSDGAGGAIVAWRDSRGGSADIYAQRISSTGAVQWAADGVALCTASDEQTYATIASDGAGGAIVTWEDYRTGGGHIYAQRISADGTPAWAPDGVALCTVPCGQRTPQIVSDGVGGAIVTWVDFRSCNFDEGDIYTQRISADGTPQWISGGVALCTANYKQMYPAIVSDGAGGSIVTWFDLRSGNGYLDTEIYAQRISAAGTVQWTADGVALSTVISQKTSDSIVSDGASGAIVTWDDSRSGSSFGIYSQRVSAAGAVHWTAGGVALCTANGFQRYPTTTSDGGGGAIVTWQNGDIYAQRVQPGGQLGGDVVGTILVRLEAIPFEGAIDVSWELAEGTRFASVTPERSLGETGPWTVVTGERRERGNLTQITDRAIEAGEPYWYRLTAVGVDGAVTTFGPVRADAVTVARFALAAPAPNPTAGPVRVEFSVGTDTPGRLSVVDVAGREMAVLAEGTFRPGRYLAVWDARMRSGRVPAGLYFVRYRTSEGSVSRPVIVVQ